MTMEMTKEQPKETRRVGLTLGAIIMSALLLIAFAFSAAPVQAATSSQNKAVKQAKAYLKKGPYSEYKLACTLRVNGFSAKDAKYGAAHCGANYNKQAERMAREYMKYDKYTKSEMMTMLTTYEGFTESQAKYACKAVGLK